MTSELNLKDQLDSDSGFKKKRAYLVIGSLILLTLSMAGASVLEINTLVVKVAFSNKDAITHILAGILLFLMVRYYGYAQSYQHQLSVSWRKSVISDARLLFYHPISEKIDGLLTKKIDSADIDDPYLEHFEYIAKLPFRREVHYLEERFDPDDGPIYQKADINLNRFTDQWSPTHLIKVFRVEVEHRLHFALKTREFLDIYYPYGFAAVAFYAYFSRYLI